MRWRAIGGTGEPYPAWLRALQGKSGVYAIRERGWFSTSVVYVGESHTGSLYKTLTRHFQSGSRGERSRKKLQWWRVGYDASQTDPGHTYERSKVEVAVRVASRARAVVLQSDWIARLKPRDNVAEVEEVPF